MRENRADISWLSNTEVFKINAICAHSDHRFYLNKEDADRENMTLRHSLNGTWKFLYSKHIAQREADFYREDYDDSKMSEIEVPSSIQSVRYNYSIPHYTNQKYPWDGHSAIIPPQISEGEKDEVGSYVRYFDLPQEYKDMRVFVSFQGVENAFYVWLNGEFIGYSEDSFTPSEFEITQYLRDKNNKIAVEVHKASTGAWLEDQDFWRLSGIFRDVYIYAIPDIHLRDMFITSSFNNDYTSATLNIEGSIEKELETELNMNKVSVSADIIYDNERVACIQETDISDSSFILTTDIDNPRLWSAETPHLYDIYIYIKKDNVIEEVVRYRYGLREFKMDNGVMKLNGKRIVFKGVNRHEFSCYNLRSVSEEEMLWDIKFLKANNINAVRTSHYPNNTRWYELCDEYGIYLIDETNLETHGTWNYGKERDMNAIPGDKPEWLYIVLDRAKSMFMRDKNHSSVLIWSCGNESYGGLDLYKMSEFFRKADSTRLVHYEGIYNDRTYNDTSDMESRMYATVTDIKQYLDTKPTKPYISCEYSHAMGNSCGGLSLYTELEDMYEQYQGGFIWDYIDQGIMREDIYGNKVLAYGGDFTDRPTDYNFCTNGIIFADRKTSPKMQEIKHLFANIVIKPNKAGVHISNNNLFVNTDYVKFEYTVELDGNLVDKGGFVVDVKPGEDRLVSVPYRSMNESGEYAITIKALLKNDTKWEKAGYEVAFGQYIFVNEKNISEKLYEQISNVQTTYRVVNGKDTLGINGDNFKVMFDKQKGSIISYVLNGIEYMAKPPYPDYGRAMTDNDRGCGYDYELAEYMTASIVRKCVHFSYTIERGHVKVRVEYKNAMSADTKTTIIYTVFAGGEVLVEEKYKGAKGMPVMPQFGITFATYRQYNYMRYYGNGPMENYSDRAKGARLGIYETNATDNMTPYIIPQECGNRTKVRWMQITDEKGHGFEIISGKHNIEVTVLPYSSVEINQALHKEELPNPYYTYITVSGRKMGVGGDNSWGARPHDEYLISGEEEHEFSFMISPLR